MRARPPLSDWETNRARRRPPSWSLCPRVRSHRPLFCPCAGKIPALGSIGADGKRPHARAPLSGGPNPHVLTHTLPHSHVCIARSLVHLPKTRAQVLLPLVNIPMLEYTLESLAATGVREILVVCCAHAEQVWQREKRPERDFLWRENAREIFLWRFFHAMFCVSRYLFFLCTLKRDSCALIPRVFCSSRDSSLVFLLPRHAEPDRRLPQVVLVADARAARERAHHHGRGEFLCRCCPFYMQTAMRSNPVLPHRYCRLFNHTRIL